MEMKVFASAESPPCYRLLKGPMVRSLAHPKAYAEALWSCIISKTIGSRSGCDAKGPSFHARCILR